MQLMRHPVLWQVDQLVRTLEMMPASKENTDMVVKASELGNAIDLYLKDMPARTIDNPNELITQFFDYTHLPPHLQEVSKPFHDLAQIVLAFVPRNTERTVALRKLLEAKDAAVRAKLAK